MSDDAEIIGIIILFIALCIFVILIAGCTTQPDDHILRYILTHPECQTQDIC